MGQLKSNSANTFLSISKELIRIREKGEMLSFLHETLRQFVAYDDGFILKYNREKKKFIAYIYHHERSVLASPALREHVQVIDWAAKNLVDVNGGPHVMNINDLRKNNHTVASFLSQGGIKQLASLKLYEGNTQIGLLILLSQQSNTFPRNVLKLLDQLSASISMVTANIIANEEIKEREAEKNLLLSLSNEIAALTRRADLFRVVNQKLKQLFNVKDLGFAQKDEDGKTFSAFLEDLQGSFTAHPNHDEITAGKYSVDDPVISFILNSDEPVMILVDEWAAQPGMPPYVGFWKDAGISRLLMSALRAGGEDIGAVYFILDNHVDISPNSILVKGVCSQLAVAISNILANERVLAREAEKNLLLALSNEIAALQRRGDLFKVVNDRLKKLISASEVIFCKKDEDGTTISIFLEEFQENFTGHPDHDKIFSGHYNIDDPFHTFILQSEDPVILIMEEWFSKPNMPVYVYFCKEAGINRMLASALRVGGIIVGEVYFVLDDHVAINPRSILIKGICSQLAVAVSNILASERAIARETEKNILLTLSNEIAASKSRQDLFALVDGKIKNLFSINEFVFARRNQDGKTFSTLLAEFKPETQTLPDHDQIMGGSYSAEDIFLSQILQSEDPVLIETYDWYSQPDMPAYVYFWKEAGIRRMLGSALRVGGEAIGMVFFILDYSVRINPISILIKGICSQLAVAVSNILANEKIQEREAEKTKLLEFSNAMASVRDKRVLGKILKRQLHELFQIVDYVIFSLDHDKNYLRPVLMDTDYGLQSEFDRLLETELSVSDGVFNKILAASDLVTFNADEWNLFPKIPFYANAAKSFGSKQIAGMAIMLGEENIGIINFLKDGADDFAIQRPLFKSICSQIAIALSNIIANDAVIRHLSEIEKYKQKLEEENEYLQEEIDTTHNNSEILGDSVEIRRVLRLVAQVAPSDSTVLLLGETGTGKELVARAIHYNSGRKDNLMVKINCAALPANLIESELFGHERGAFTGAVERRIGKFELANQGTMFLDEIGEMPLELQAKLLRALQEKEIERIGGKTVSIDVRIIAATNRDLDKMMEEGSFRRDLFYRLNIFPISIPPLRTHKEDIPVLVSQFIKRYSKKAGKKISKLSNQALKELMEYHWPGNIRELEHLIERSILLASGDTIKEINLPTRKASPELGLNESPLKLQSLFDNEREYILKILKYVKGKISGADGAAQILGLPPSTLHSKMKKLGIRREFYG